jgi:hypothetical protein
MPARRLTIGSSRTSWFLPAVLLVSMQLMPSLSLAQFNPPANPQIGSAAAAQGTLPMRIILVEWRIKKGRENEFLEYWSTRSTVPDRSGLIAEFLNRVENREQFPWIRWEFNESWTTFVTTGLWREAADFQQNFGRFIDDTKPPFEFEAERRRRVLVAPERWRIGGSRLPTSDHPGVR